MTRAPFRSALVVEDHPAQRKLAERVLLSLGVESVYLASDGTEVEALLLAHRPELLLADIDMPGKDGMAVLRDLRDKVQMPAIVICSSLEPAMLTTVERLARDYNLPLLGALPKPLGLQALAEMLARSPLVPKVPRAPIATLPESTLREALAHAWFEPFFEPKLERESGQVIGAEALARLRLPGEGLVPPIRFIGPLEDLGLIADMTWQVMDKALAALARWAQRGWHPRLALNLSPELLKSDEVIAQVTRLSDLHGIPPRQLVLEITESAALDNRGEVLERLARLRLRGYGLSIDDFGTGYSSMGQLSNVPYTELKLDQVFTGGAATEFKHRAVLESCMDLAKRMGLATCAEGVETAEIFQLLHDMGAHTFQGYLFTRPLPEDEFLAWATSWNQNVDFGRLYLSR